MSAGDVMNKATENRISACRENVKPALNFLFRAVGANCKRRIRQISERIRMGMRANKVRESMAGEEGSVLVLALAMLTLLTLIGISATTTSTIEIQIAGNEKIHTRNLYLAEGAAMQCAQAMEDHTDPKNNTAYMNIDITESDIRALNFTNSQTSSIAPQTSFAAVNAGLVGSLKMGQPSIHAYSIYGWCAQDGGLVIVELGYRRAF